MPDPNDSQGREPGHAPAHGKKYARPTLTEYGSVAKLTMAKGNTAVETPTQQKPGCL
jgi:hypothetical protein